MLKSIVGCWYCRRDQAYDCVVWVSGCCRRGQAYDCVMCVSGYCRRGQAYDSVVWVSGSAVTALVHVEEHEAFANNG